MKIYQILPGSLLDITDLTESVQWSGERGIAARRLVLNGINYTGGYHLPNPLNPGSNILLMEEDRELFRGKILRDVDNHEGLKNLTAYDQLIYWSNNRDSFHFEKIKASDILKHIAQKFQIPLGLVEDTGFIISNQTNSGNYLCDVIYQALETTYKQSGRRFYLKDNKGKIELLDRVNWTQVLVLETGVNISEWSRTRSAEDMSNRIKLVTNAGRTIATSKDDDLISKFGIFQYYEEVSEKLNIAQLQQKANTMLTQKSRISTTIELTNVLGDSNIVSGVVVYLKIPELQLTKAYYVEKDRHSISGGEHLMDLTLVEGAVKK